NLGFRERKLVALAGSWIELLDLVRLAFPLLGVGRRLTLDGDVGPLFGVFGVELEPFLKAGLGIRLDRLDRAFRLAHAAIDALVGMNDEHVLALVEAIDGADRDAIHVLAADAIVVDDVGHSSSSDLGLENAWFC